MTMRNRILIGLGILLVDLIIFFVPLTAFFLIYIVIYNPPWFKKFLHDLDNNQTTMEKGDRSGSG